MAGMLYFSETVSEAVMIRNFFGKTAAGGMIILAAGIFCPSGISASQTEAIERYKKNAETISRKIEKNKAELQNFTKKEAEVVNSLHETDLSLSRVKKQVAVSRSDMETADQKLKEIAVASEELKKKIQIGEEYASRRMAALYKLSCLGEMPVPVSAESAAVFFQQKTSLERILAHDENVLQTLEDNKEKLSRITDSLNARKKEKLLLESAYKNQLGTMAEEKERRAKLLSEIRGKKSLTLASISSLKQSAAELDRKIESLKALKAARPKTRVSEKDEILSGGKFASYRGMLKMPVDGRIVSFFGRYKHPEFNVMNFRSGIDIAAKQGDSVRAVCDGEVLYANWFKGYGNMIIIDHGDSYYTVYAHADDIYKKEGDRVKTGEVIATVGDSGSMSGPGMHFEVRHHGKSLDPVKWLRNG
jgi:murein hydrolase activator